MSAPTLNIASVFTYFFGRFNSKPIPANNSADDIQLQTGVNQYLRDMLAQATVEISQLKFLLASAPMIDMIDPKDANVARRLSKMVSPFAYIHPKTLAPFVTTTPPKRVYVFSGSKTLWVPMSTMPEGRVIFSPIPVPGIEHKLVD